jgi:hypothetical protein
MKEMQCKEILNNLELMKKCMTRIVDELNTNNIMGRKASFSYLDFQIDTLYEYIQETAEKVKELES